VILGEGCLFTFVGASRGHLCDSTTFLFVLAFSVDPLRVLSHPISSLEQERALATRCECEVLELDRWRLQSPLTRVVFVHMAPGRATTPRVPSGACISARKYDVLVLVCTVEV